MEYKTIHRLFWVWDFNKEEDWLNEMAQSGWVLDDVGFMRFTFIKCDPAEYTIRLEMHGYDESYIDFMRQTNAEYIGRVFGWIFFRKKAQFGEFNIFSDIDSKLAHLTRISRLLAIVGGANLILGLMNSLNPKSNMGSINLLCATLLMYALGRIHGKKEALDRERSLYE